MARRTPEEAARTRQQLLATGLTLFSRQGIEATTLKQIAAQAGLTHGALYWHFRNRADLLQQLHHAYALPFEQQYLEQRQGAQQDALEALRQYVLGVLSTFAASPEAAAAYRVFHLQPGPVADLVPLQAELAAAREAWLEHLRYFLKQARKQKQLRKRASPQALAFTLQLALSGLLHEWLRRDGDFELLAEGRRLLTLLLDGLPQK